jgi:GWxTD domain-containing protein
MAPFLLALVLGTSPAALERPAIKLDCVTFQVSDSVQEIEIDYDIPYTSVTFVRDSADFVARFTVRVQCWDSRGNQVAAQDWDRAIRVGNYEPTMRSQDRFTGRETLRVPMGRLDAEVAFADQQSEREQTWKFKLEPPKYLSDLRIEPKPGRAIFQSSDTLHVYFETYDRGSELDSGRAQITRERRVYAAQRFKVERDSWRMPHRLDFPLSPLDDGDYQLQLDVKGRSPKVAAMRRAVFQVGNSFFRSERTYREKVNQLVYIANDAETQKLLKAAPGERESLWNAFWAGKDRTPTTPQNETEEEYFARIQYCIDHFGHGDKGWRSDRAKVYVRLGAPDNIDSSPFESPGNAHEVWYYYGQSLTLTFEDVNGFGEYKLVDPADFLQTQGWQK